METRRSSSENTGPESLQPKYQYVWSLRYIDTAVLRDENTDSDSTCDDGRIYCLADANFNVTTIVDTGGDTLERYVYSPYGVLTIYDATWSNIRSASSYDNAYTYTGRRYDKETGLYYYRHRCLSAQLGRFLSRDPIGYEAGVSLVEYVWDAPTYRSDPVGLQVFGPPYIDHMIGSFVQEGIDRIRDAVTSPIETIWPPVVSLPTDSGRRTACGGGMTISLYDGSDTGCGGVAGGNSFYCGARNIGGTPIDMNGGGIDPAIQAAGDNCICRISILDHGGGGMQQIGKQYMGDSDIDKLCDVMCSHSSIYLYGCHTALSGGNDILSRILARCPKVDVASGCTGCYMYPKLRYGFCPDKRPWCDGTTVFRMRASAGGIR